MNNEEIAKVLYDLAEKGYEIEIALDMMWDLKIDGRGVEDSVKLSRDGTFVARYDFAMSGIGKGLDRLEELEEGDEQAYFWTEEWQAAEREADEDIASGRGETFDTMEELIDELEDG